MIKINRFAMESIKLAARREAPDEMCGLLLRWVSDRHEESPTLLFALARNTSCQPHDSFVVDPETHLWFYRSDEFDIVGSVHSHVETDSRPSRIDNDAMVQGLICGIYSIAEDELNFWELQDGDVVEGDNWKVTQLVATAVPFEVVRN